MNIERNVSRRPRRSWRAWVLGGLGLLGCAGQQPAAPCIVARAPSPFIVKWRMNTAALAVSSECQEKLADFNLSLLYADRFGSVKGENPTVAIRPSELSTGGELVDLESTGLAYGELERNTIDDDGMCHVNFGAPTEAALTDAKGKPARNVTYAFRTLTSLSDAAHAGTQISVDLVYTRDSCTAQFEGIGINPAVGCATDDDCDPRPNLEQKRASGSGLSPDYATRCVADGRAASYFANDSVTGFCVIAGDSFPALTP